MCETHISQICHLIDITLGMHAVNFQRKSNALQSRFSNFTLHQELVMQNSAHNVQHTNNNKWQFVVELFEEDSPMTRNNSEVAPEL